MIYKTFLHQRIFPLINKKKTLNVHYVTISMIYFVCYSTHSPILKLSWMHIIVNRWKSQLLINFLFSLYTCILCSVLDTDSMNSNPGFIDWMQWSSKSVLRWVNTSDWIPCHNQMQLKISNWKRLFHITSFHKNPFICLRKFIVAFAAARERNAEIHT